MTPEEFIRLIEGYDTELSAMLSRFRKTSDGLHIDHDDDPRYRQIVQEVVDLLDDSLGKNRYSTTIASIVNEGVRNFYNSPSYKSLEDVVSVLRSIVTRVTRNPEVLGAAARPKASPWDIWTLLHPTVAQLAKPRMEGGHYADAVECVLKELNTVVKLIHKTATGEELDGSALMQRALSLSNPTIVLDDLNTDSGRNVQVGYMQILAGAMTGIRNPKAHANVVITPERAIHHLFVASLLFFRIDERT